MTVASEPILVIGATGRHGGTGAVVARSLRDRGLFEAVVGEKSQALPSGRLAFS